jgi:flavin reductase (DIM6/NTAB) family NADH-FMN oxidoreductase RutF
MYRALRNIARHARIRPLSTTSDALNTAYRALLRQTAQPVAVVTVRVPSADGPKFHGATLSSFSSVALEPVPIIAFALRLPSRMATLLKEAQESLPFGIHMAMNLLSSSQSTTAHQFSRPDLFPEPFETISHDVNEDGMPIISGSLGALSCTLINAIPLYDVDGPSPPAGYSELFIARVKSLEISQTVDTPLVYCRQKYTTILPPASA